MNCEFYACAGSTSPSITLAEEVGKIHARCWKFGIVTVLGFPSTYQEETKMLGLPMIENQTQALVANEEYAYAICSMTMDSNGRIRGEHPSDVVWRMLSLDRQVGGRCDATDRKHYDAWIEVYATGEGTMSGKFLRGKSPATGENSVNIKEFQAITSTMDGRVLCLITGDQISGRFLGVLPNDARIGDTIALLCGGRTPFVFRLVEDTGEYQLFGLCYVHGIMDGECLDGSCNLPRDIEGAAFEDFVIG